MSPLEEAIKIVANGNKSEFARILSKKSGLPLSQQAVSKWVHRSKNGCAGPFVLIIEELTNKQIKREQLRPDIFQPKRIAA